MPHYYFHIYNDVVTCDDEGTELADDAAARAHAVKAARSLAADTVSHGYIVTHHRIEILNSDHDSVDSVRFDEAVEIRR